ncbi:hypothetical protein J7K44_02035 [bacterium]|nr:hypothetical protein [bacterium]
MIDKLNPIKESTKETIPEKEEVSYKESLERKPEVSSPSTSEYIKQLEEKIRRLEQTIKEMEKEKKLSEKVIHKDEIIPSGSDDTRSYKFTSDDIKKQTNRISSLNKEDQVKTLCNLAFQKGLDFAINVAKSLNNPYVLDEFHDRLVDEFYQRLIEEGKLEKI